MLHSTLAALALATGLTPSGDACVTGAVLDAAGRPVASAAVSLVARLGAALPLRTASDATGSFQLAGLAGGAYWLVVERLGFEPDIRELELAERVALGTEVRLTPLGALLGRERGRGELPWLVRALGGDPTRDAGPVAVTASETAPEPRSRAVQGRVGWNAMAGDASVSSELAATGNRAQLELNGNLAREVTWFVDGRMDAIDQAPAVPGAELGSQEIRYGVGYGDDAESLQFAGELKRATRTVSADSAAELGERRARYELGWRSGGPQEGGLDVSLGYRASVSEDGHDALGASAHHSILEGRGDHLLRLGSSHLVSSRLTVRAQRWSAPNQSLLAEATPQGGQLLDGRYLSPRSWYVEVSESYSWRLAPELSFRSGVDLARGAGDAGASLLRPRVGGDLGLGDRARLSAELSWAIEGSGDELAVPGASRSERQLGLRIGFEQGLGPEAWVRVTALRNGYRDHDQAPGSAAPNEDYLLFARGEVTSEELRLDLRAPAVLGVAGFAAVSFGQAAGELSYVPLAHAAPGGSVVSLGDGSVRFASASLGGSVPSTGTGLLVRYRLLDTMDPTGDYARVDVELEQGLPWWELLGARLDLLVALSDYIRRPDLPSSSGSTLPFEPAPVLAAGVGVRF